MFAHHTSPSPVATSGTARPISHLLSCDHLPTSRRVFMSAIMSHDEPKHFTQAVKHDHWRAAMSEELWTLEANQTWSLQPLPPEKKPVSCKRVYKVKSKADGIVE